MDQGNIQFTSKPKSNFALIAFTVMAVIGAGGAAAFFLSSNSHYSKADMVTPPAANQIYQEPSPTPTVALTQQYTNPFDDSSQTQNPFVQSDNPFDSISR